MVANSYDLIILGSGPGGYVAAIRAAQLGLKAAIVERELLGGICLNWGCIPTKALLRSAEIFHHMKHAAHFGLAPVEPTFELAEVIARSRAVAKQLNQGVTGLMKKHKIAVHIGDGVLTAKTKIAVTKDGQTTELSAKNIIVATGARARNLPFAEADGKRIWTYRHAMTPPEMPTSLLVIGSGAIGLEFASFYGDMGAKIAVVEMVDRILPVEDEEVSAFMTTALTKQGISIRAGAKVKKLDVTDRGVTAQVEDKDGKVSSEKYSHVIAAIGIVPNVENIGLEAIGVEVDQRFHIETDGYCRTNVEGIYAIGDVTDGPWLAHKAMHEAVIAAEHIAGQHPHAMDKRNIPGCTYCRPQVASVGLTEAKAREAGYKVTVGKFPFIGNGKAIALGEPDGFVKTVFDEVTGELLGAHMVGAEVTEMIQGYTIGKTLETTDAELINTIFPHPTISEAMHESVLAAFRRTLHI